jgi:membrane-associated phospholipid phosphatase
MIAGTPTPSLDRALARLSGAADYSRISIGVSLAIALADRRRGKRAAVMGMVSVWTASAVVNLVLKRFGRRRPDREAAGSVVDRHVPMPESTSFPSGHSAAAFAYASGVGHVLPVTAIPLHALATLIAYSRVHTGVHFPGDVVAGAAVGTAVAQVTTSVLDRISDSRRLGS